MEPSSIFMRNDNRTISLIWKIILTLESFHYILINVLANKDKQNNDSLAQLGERYLDRVEVAGSNPVGIILFEKRESLEEGVHAFFLHRTFHLC